MASVVTSRGTPRTEGRAQRRHVAGRVPERALLVHPGAVEVHPGERVEREPVGRRPDELGRPGRAQPLLEQVLRRPLGVLRSHLLDGSPLTCQKACYLGWPALNAPLVNLRASAVRAP